MNHPSDVILSGAPITAGQRWVDRSEFGGENEQPNFDAKERLLGSLKRRWWYYLLVTILAGVASYFVADEYGSYVYTATTYVQGNETLPLPGRTQLYLPPKIEDFPRYLYHPEVNAALQNDFAIDPTPGAQENSVSHEYDRATKVVAISATRDSKSDAVDLVNRAVDQAIKLAREERSLKLEEALKQYEQLVANAQNIAQGRRRARANKVSALKSGAPAGLQREAEQEYEELTSVIRRLTTDIDMMQRSVARAERLQNVLNKEQTEIVVEARQELLTQLKETLQESAAQYADESKPAEEIRSQIQQLDALEGEEISSLEDLDSLVSEASKVVGVSAGIPDRYVSRLSRISDSLYEIRNEALLLPESLEAAENELQEKLDLRAQIQFPEPLDIENHPDVFELDAQIAQAEAQAKAMSEAVQWAENMQKISSDSFEVLG